MKTILIISLLLFGMIWIGCKKESEETPGPGKPWKVYEGNLENPDTAELRQFYEAGYTVVNGNIELREIAGLTDLNYFSLLDTVNGSIFFEKNPDLQMIKGFNNLKHVLHNLVIRKEKITSIIGFNHLRYIGGALHFDDNPQLETISGFNSLDTIDFNLLIYTNQSLKTIDGFEKLTHISYRLSILSNTMITDLSALSNLKSIGSFFEISNNTEMTSLQGLESLDSISNKMNIIHANDKLVDFCALERLCEKEDLKISIYQNGYNPSVEDIRNGACKP